MLRMDRIKAAVDDVTAAAVLGEGWEPALAQFSYACGARGAVLMRGAVGMRNCAHHVLAVITTDDMAELVKAYVAGRRPPNSRYGRVQYGSAARFRVDHDDYTDAELARDPYYQEFLRPAGYFWHANLPLTLGRDGFVELSLKRRIETSRSGTTASSASPRYSSWIPGGGRCRAMRRRRTPRARCASSGGGWWQATAPHSRRWIAPSRGCSPRRARPRWSR